MYKLSFGYIKKLSEHVAEVIINNDIEVTIEMVEELDNLLSSLFSKKFGLLVNKINHYAYTYEAQLSIGSLEKMCAIAVVHYHPKSAQSTKQVKALRANDNWNIKEFSGLELGYHQALVWLDRQLKYAINNI